MFFLCGSCRPEGAAHAGRTVEAMAGARRTAAGADTRFGNCGMVYTADAAARVTRREIGRVTGLLCRPEHGPGDTDERALEAILAAYDDAGTLATLDLAGSYVLLIADAGRARVVLAVDRFGACPLYVRADDGALSFASDLHALAAEPGFDPAIDPQAIYDYVFFHCIPAPRSIYRGVRKVDAGGLLVWDGVELTAGVHWQPHFPADGPVPTGLESALRDALEGGVARHAGGECGAFLSGGLDSSSVAGMLGRVAGSARTFTIGFDAPGYDESGFARTAADHFGTEHHEYFVTPADVRDSMPAIAAHYGEPFGNSSVIPTYHCARFAREHGVDHLLAGDGGDELFAGNTRYVDQRVFEHWFRLPSWVQGAIEAGYRVLPFLASVPVARKGAGYIRQARMGLPDRLQAYNFLHRFEPERVFRPEWLSGVDTSAPWQLWRTRYAEPESATPLQRMLYLDWKFTLAANDLVKVSHMCDLAGVEVSYPMLDDAVVDVSLRVPPAGLLPDGELRGFYKRAFRGFLPDEIITKTKHGFGLPFGVWMREDRGLRDLAGDALAGLRNRNIVEPVFLDEARRLHADGTAGYYGELVWILTMLELWFEAHGV